MCVMQACWVCTRRARTNRGGEVKVNCHRHGCGEDSGRVAGQQTQSQRDAAKELRQVVHCGPENLQSNELTTEAESREHPARKHARRTPHTRQTSDPGSHEKYGFMTKSTKPLKASVPTFAGPTPPSDLDVSTISVLAHLSLPGSPRPHTGLLHRYIYTATLTRGGS